MGRRMGLPKRDLLRCLWITYSKRYRTNSGRTSNGGASSPSNRRARVLVLALSWSSGCAGNQPAPTVPATTIEPPLASRQAEADPDGDGVIGANDRCPDVPEDCDSFEDTDGCPEPDNDHDLIVD